MSLLTLKMTSDICATAKWLTHLALCFNWPLMRHAMVCCVCVCACAWMNSINSATHWAFMYNTPMEKIIQGGQSSCLKLSAQSHYILEWRRRSVSLSSKRRMSTLSELETKFHVSSSLVVPLPLTSLLLLSVSSLCVSPDANLRTVFWIDHQVRLQTET